MINKRDPNRPQINRLELHESEKEGLLLGVRKNGVPLSVRKSRNRIFTVDEWKLFYSKIKSNRAYIFLDILLNTGARINEARHIKVEDIDFDNQQIILRVVKHKNNYADGRTRIIPISSQFVKRLQSYIKNYNLTSEDYLPSFSTSALRLAMHKALKEVGIKDWYLLSPHNIRKTFETWLVANNVGHLKLMKHMGHDTITALNHYIQPDLFTHLERMKQREMLGDIYSGDGHIDILYDKINVLESVIKGGIKIEQKRVEESIC